MKKIVKSSSGNEIDAQKLLDAAKGVIPQEEVTENYWLDASRNTREFIRFRRSVRRGIFKIIKWETKNLPWREDIKLVHLYDIIDEQLNPNFGMKWENFTDVWDIHPKHGLTVIRKEAWVREGGGYDKELGIMYPHAFTHKKDESAT